MNSCARVIYQQIQRTPISVDVQVDICFHCSHTAKGAYFEKHYERRSFPKGSKSKVSQCWMSKLSQLSVFKKGYSFRVDNFLDNSSTLFALLLKRYLL